MARKTALVLFFTVKYIFLKIKLWVAESGPRIRERK